MCGEVSHTSPETFPLTDTTRGVFTAMLVYCSLVNDDGYASYCRAERFFNSKIQLAHERVKEFYRTDQNVAPDADGISDIIVSFDCAWETRGHQSHIGLAFIVEANTGAILDKQVLCNLCSVCERKRQSLPANDYANWFLSHTHCSKNFDGPAGRMEAEEAQRMFLRSTDFGLWYAYFVGDGDSSAYRSVRFIYGPDREVVKYVSVNHVGKRMGTRLRKLKGTLTTPVTTRTGRVMRRSLLACTLINKNIDLSSRLSTLALKRSIKPAWRTCGRTQRAFLLSFFQRFLGAAPVLSRCADSWCFYNTARAAGRVPRSHSQENLFLRTVPPAVLQEIRAVYEDLTKDDLLSRCLPEYTQNPNESLQSKVWRKCSKSKFAGKLSAVLPMEDTPTLISNCRSRGGSESELQPELSDASAAAVTGL
ncbi:hypothetical protein C7M84_024854 [Penaeus vannamei]|uniref:Mutator-like transposase domain-containing protein n=1 Tax=Penaeus vannamei TaxID=6689 RepID=A0A423TZW7_PENVA|nr:hypothetical protein C7M84_024854 [Penaeus vannamei]